MSVDHREGEVGFDVSVFERAVGAERVSYRPGDPLVEAGDVSRDVYVLVEGSAEVFDGTTEAPVARLGPGSVIGELTAVAGGVRNATVRAVTAVRALRIEHDAFHRLLDGQPDLARAISEEAVRRLDQAHFREALTRLLGSVDDTVVADLQRVAEWVRLEAGGVLYETGEPADAGYLIISGRLRLVDEEGSTIEELGRDQFVGEQGLLLDAVRIHTAVAVRDTLMVRIPLRAFLLLINRHPSVLVPVVTEVVRRSAGSRRGEGRERSVAVAVCADINARAFCARLAAAMEAHGPVAHVWPARVDSLLENPGISQSPPQAPGAVRVGRLLHEMELESTYLLCEADVPGTEWSDRVVRQADRMVVVLSSTPSPGEMEAADRHLAAAPPHVARLLVVAHPPSAERPSGTAALLERWPGVEVVHIRSGSATDAGRLARILAGTAVGIVFGGGGARGFAHIGVYRAMIELGIPIDIIGGASIGAPVAAGIAQGVGPGEGLVVAERLFKDLLDYTIPVVSLVKGEKITASIERQFGGWDIGDFWTSFFCVSTNLTRAVEVVHRSGSATQAIRASVSIPGVMPPVAFGEDLLVDGGVLNNLPADVMRASNPTGTVIAVDVAPPRGPRASGDLDLSVSGWRALSSRLRGNSQYPGLTAVLMRTLITASLNKRERVLRDGIIDFYLDLDLRGVSLLEFDRVRPVADAGYEAAMPRLEAWLEAREAGA